MDIAQFAAQLEQGYLEEKTKGGSERYQARSNIASKIGHPCPRYMYYLRTLPGSEFPDFRESGILAMRDGKLHERDIIRTIQDAGFTAEETEVLVEWPELQIRGKIDARMRVNGNKIPLEVKSSSRFSWDGMYSIADMSSSEKLWFRQYAAQILIYCLLENAEGGILFAKNKDTGRPKVIPVRLEDHLEFTEACLKRAEIVNKAIEAKSPPVFYNRPTVCGTCDICGYCCPPVLKGEGQVDFKDDVEAGEKISIMLETDEAAKKNKKAKEWLKDNVTAVVEDEAIIFGPDGSSYLCEVSNRKSSRIDKAKIPEDILEAATIRGSYKVGKYSALEDGEKGAKK